MNRSILLSQKHPLTSCWTPTGLNGPVTDLGTLLSSSKQHRTCLLLHTKQRHNLVAVAYCSYKLTAQSYRKNTTVSTGRKAWFPIKRNNDRKLKLHSENRCLYANFGLEIIIGRDGLEDKTTKDGGCVRDSSGLGEDLVAGLFWTR
jgi:hypothetical protein